MQTRMLINGEMVEGGGDALPVPDPATGMAAMRAASNQIRHVHLELGGKAPVVAFDDADIVTNEVFGPVVTLSRFSDDEEALKIANAGRYGLASSVWTRDLSTAMKGSGTGCDMSVHALDAYTSVRHVMISHG